MANVKKRPKKPTTIFHKCPDCQSDNIHKMNVDVFCFDCDWNSWESYVASGGMDDLAWAYLEHFGGSQLYKNSIKEEETQTMNQGECHEAV